MPEIKHSKVEVVKSHRTLLPASELSAEAGQGLIYLLT